MITNALSNKFMGKNEHFRDFLMVPVLCAAVLIEMVIAYL